MRVEEPERLRAEEELGEKFSRRLRVEDVDLDRGFDSMRLMRERMLALLGDVSGLQVLDVGCGLGRLSVTLARRGALVTAGDISEGMLAQTRRLSEKYGVAHRVTTVRMNAEAMPFADASFDLVVGTGILHHLDVPRALGEIRRVLRPGGRALFEEPLGHNPILRLFRRLTPDRRSRFERPFLVREIEGWGRHFERVSHEEHYLLTIPLFFLKKYLPLNWGGSVIPTLARLDDALWPAGRSCAPTAGSPSSACGWALPRRRVALRRRSHPCVRLYPPGSGRTEGP
ncbi:MAG: class I SAM-dependent methyltransferase [Firmicutes bacterium]|nr:class I SAM-dependent methyltransferase [Bacillota bacterium]